jgi:repressor LexA
MQEVADQLNLSKVTVFEHVAALVEKGLLRRSPHKARSLEPAETGTQIPLAGRIAAGCPIEAIEDRDVLDLEAVFASGQRTFVLQVQGDSMIDDHIADGDFVVVESRQEVRDGETVVALLADGEATLKRLYREGDRWRLQPANEAFEPIYVSPGEIEVQGVVIGVVRRY